MKSVQHSDLKRVKQIAMNGYYSVLTTIELYGTPYKVERVPE